MEAPYMSLNRCMDKEDFVYVHHIVLLSRKYEWNFVIFRNTDGPRWPYAKWNKTGREKQILYVFTYMWNLKIKTNEWV